eukprot:CAMPEP_0179852162 /NCGR_PEP_ID=MMETSP0982-20121206/8647_1 /TAXON_ID=483367 /ORGANISM="non described non described, Strain CCMP 2436" /LENGTH=197 /DNA_ID=CAMNT_0021737751 /DNA_START=2177 /DNA_END=2771 /DNA_ORIENTATION=+
MLDKGAKFHILEIALGGDNYFDWHTPGHRLVWDAPIASRVHKRHGSVVGRPGVERLLDGALKAAHVTKIRAPLMRSSWKLGKSVSQNDASILYERPPASPSLLVYASSGAVQRHADASPAPGSGSLSGAHAPAATRRARPSAAERTAEIPPLAMLPTAPLQECSAWRPPTSAAVDACQRLPRRGDVSAARGGNQPPL